MKRVFLGGFTAGLCAVALLIGISAFAIARVVVPALPQRFATNVYSFELQPGWQCRRDDTEFVCRSGKPPSNAIIITAMKWRGKEDTMEAYEAHLRGPMRAADGDGRAELRSLRRFTSNGTEWIEGVLMNSEIKGYQTTYLAMHTAEVGLLITHSIHGSAPASRENELRVMMDSLRVYQSRALISPMAASAP